MGDIPSSVAELLQRAELTQYAAAFEEEGWDSVTHLLNIKEEQLAVLITDVKMKSGHALRSASAKLSACRRRPSVSLQYL